jgi:beta-lactamase superfamily II metal-dependent hydrolase
MLQITAHSGTFHSISRAAGAVSNLAGLFPAVAWLGYTASQMETIGFSALRRLPSTFLACFLAFTALSVALSAQTVKTLRIYTIDVEGGQSTLLVAPSGESLLVDSGWPGFDSRDAARIQTAMKDAGVTRIDHLLTTHYHRDHVGGLPQLVAQVPVGEFLDHGPNREDSDVTRTDYGAYLKAIEGHARRTVHPGDTIHIPGLSIVVVAADGEHIAAIPGIAPAPNSACAAEQPWPDDPTENARSVGILLTYGRFRFLDLGDLTGAKEVALVCPNSPLPHVDLFLVSHHGINKSNSAALIHAIHPRVAIMNNGARKGGSPEAWQTVHASPGLEDLYQLHTAEASDAAHNSSEPLIANPVAASDIGASFKVVATANGSFSITNARTSRTKSYLHE